MISDDNKDSMRLRLFQFQNAGLTADRVGSAYGKPNLKPIPDSKTSLSDLIGPGSLRFFTIINSPHEFLHAPADQWAENEEYKSMKEIVENLQVVNEAAERGVKLCHDFLGVTQSEKRFQDVLQVVESSRKHVPNQRKLSSASQKKSWFLVRDRE